MIDITKVMRTHLRRVAYVYVRQSTVMQIQRNPESTDRQYGLLARATELGWPRENADAHVDVTALQMPFQDATFFLLRQLVKNLSQMPPNRPVDFLPSVFGDKDNMVFAVVPRVR